MPGSEYVYSNFGYCLLGRVIERVTGLSYIDFVRQAFKVDCELAGNTFDLLKSNENTYYATRPTEVYNMDLARMDSCAGLIITPKELIKFANQVPGDLEQRGSISGAESLILKQGHLCMVAFCNRRKSYNIPLPLKELF